MASARSSLSYAAPCCDMLRPLVADNNFARHVIAQIEGDGYAVVPGIISIEEADREYARMWRWVETVAPWIRRRQPASWSHQGGADPWPCSQRDMMQLHQAGWLFGDLREKMAERIFEKLYGTQELHSSKDGFTLQRPTQRELGRSPNDHFDQGCTLGLQCVQGSIALTDQEHDDGCFLCWPGSHRLHSEIMALRSGRGGTRQDFIILTDEDKELLHSHGIEPKRVPVKRGDVILWRSDLVHKGAPPIGQRNNFRAVAYICMLPASLTPHRVYEEKLKAFEQLETGSHWPCREKWFKSHRTSQLAVQPYFKELPQLTPRQRLLYGLEKYPILAPSPEPSVAGSAQAAPVRRRWRHTLIDLALQAKAVGTQDASSAQNAHTSDAAQLGQNQISMQGKHNAADTTAECIGA